MWGMRARTVKFDFIPEASTHTRLVREVLISDGAKEKK